MATDEGPQAEPTCPCSVARATEPRQSGASSALSPESGCLGNQNQEAYGLGPAHLPLQAAWSYSGCMPPPCPLSKAPGHCQRGDSALWFFEEPGRKHCFQKRRLKSKLNGSCELIWGLPGWLSGKESTCNAASCRRPGLEVEFLDGEDPLEEEMATHSSILS